EPDEPTAQSRRAHALDRLAADEAALRGLDRPSETRLQRIRRLIDVVAVERVAHLEPERVARAEADRRDAVGGARLQQRPPEPRRLRPRHVELEPILAGVARARDQRRHSRDAGGDEAEVPDTDDVAIGEPADQ